MRRKEWNTLFWRLIHLELKHCKPGVSRAHSVIQRGQYKPSTLVLFLTNPKHFFCGIRSRPGITSTFQLLCICEILLSKGNPYLNSIHSSLNTKFRGITGLQHPECLFRKEIITWSFSLPVHPLFILLCFHSRELFWGVLS